MRFLKMHGLGNDFVVIDARGAADPVTPALARALGDRHRGVGFDQLAVLRDIPEGTRIDFWNSDGQPATVWTLNWALGTIDRAPHPKHG